MIRITVIVVAAIGLFGLAGLNEARAQEETSSKPQRRVIVAVGAPGEEDYEPQFEEWAKRWEAAAEDASVTVQIVGLEASKETADHQLFEDAITSAVQDDPSELWIVLIGHGTFDGSLAKFNLRGPDISAKELASWLQPRSKTTVVINSTSASAPFIDRLAGPNRIVVTATKSGSQYNFARFGDYISSAMNDPAVDLDKDNQTSVLEAFLAASKAAEEFYESQGRLATEHALLDDNGDGKGTPASWYSGIRAQSKSATGAATDGFRSNQIVLIRRGEQAALTQEQIDQRNDLELQLESLRQKKENFTEDEYFRQLETICLKLAVLYRETDED